MNEEIRRPWDKRGVERRKEEGNINQSRRDFLGTLGAGATIGVTSFAGGMALEKGRHQSEAAAESAQDAPALESPAFLQSEEAREALGNGDVEARKTAEEIIRVLFKRLDGELKYSKARQDELDTYMHSPQPNYARQSLLLDEIQFSGRLQDSLLAAIEELQEAMDARKKKPESGPKRVPDDGKKKITA